MEISSAPDFFGARISIYPLTDRYVPLILDAVEELRDGGVELETDDVSTFLGGEPEAIWSGLQRAFARAARSGEHVVMTVLLSHGCPGEACAEGSDTSGGAKPRAARVAQRARERSGIEVSCQWSLYPLGSADHMQAIDRAIDLTRSADVYDTGRHFVSHLRGDLSDVLGAIRRAFDCACAEAGHVTAHATLSANSPSARRERP